MQALLCPVWEASPCRLEVPSLSGPGLQMAAEVAQGCGQEATWCRVSQMAGRHSGSQAHRDQSRGL